MNYSSFYGGRQGSAFIIVQSYKSIAEMVEAFQQGGAYTTVGYDEYVIIDTENKNDKDNGKIYRRGYDYSNEIGGAIYIGQIVGPTGPAPHLELKTIKEVEAIKDEPDFDYRRGKGNYAPTENLIPGKIVNEDGTITYNDDIKWAWCSVRNADGSDTTAHIGFIIPYLVVDYTANSVDPYYNRSNNSNKFVNQNLIDRADAGDHPFYEHWDIKIPKGIKGDSFKNLRAVPANTLIQNYPGKDDDVANGREVLIYDYYHYDKDAGGEPISIYLGDYNLIDNINIDEDGTITFDYTHNDDLIYNNLFKWIKAIKLNSNTGLFEIDYNYETDPETGESTHYEMSLQWIKDITLDEYGTLHFIYTNKDDTIYKNHIKWIKDISLDSETGLLTVNYNYDKTRDGETNAKEDTQYTTYLRYMKNVRVDEDGTIHLDYSHGDEQTFDRYLKVVKSIELNTETGKLTIDYNQQTDKDNKPTHYEADLNWVKDINIDEFGTVTFDYTVDNDKTLNNHLKWIKAVTLDNKNGHFTVQYNYDTDKDGNPTIYETDLDWIKGIEVSDNGTMTLKHSSDPDTVLDTKIKWIKNTEINTGATEGSGNQKLKITYNDGTTQDIGNPLNYIIRTEITDDYHLVILHADPLKRAEIVAAGKNKEWDGRNDWQDMGSVKDDDGVLIGLNLDLASNPQLESISSSINYLNNEYPIGLVDENLYGKIVSVGTPEGNKILYAFDYSVKNGAYKGWYYLGTINAAYTVVGTETDENIIYFAQTLPVNGIWFILESPTVTVRYTADDPA